MRTLRFMMILMLPALVLGTVCGWMLGGYATGEASVMTIAGYTPPDQGNNLRSAASADAVQPAAASFLPTDRYTEAYRRWGE
jgi:hypothetical protein